MSDFGTCEMDARVPTVAAQCGHNGNITWGAQTEPRSGALAARHLGQDGLQRFWQDCRDSMSYCVAYTPDGATPYGAGKIPPLRGGAMGAQHAVRMRIRDGAEKPAAS